MKYDDRIYIDKPNQIGKYCPPENLVEGLRSDVTNDVCNLLIDCIDDYRDEIERLEEENERLTDRVDILENELEVKEIINEDYDEY